LEAEIEAVSPRVIIALGAAALIALTGYEDRRVVRTPFECDNCDEDRKIGPVVECSARWRKDIMPKNGRKKKANRATSATGLTKFQTRAASVARR